MSSAAVANDGEKKPEKPLTKVFVVAVPLLLASVVIGLWLTGALQSIPGVTKLAGGRPPEKPATAQAYVAPIFAELPEMVTNLNAPGRRPIYVKLKARVELAKAEDQAVFAVALPRVVDLFQTYLREMRPDELRGSAGTYRLRAELVARANIVVAPARVVDVLFGELLVQ